MAAAWSAFSVGNIGDAEARARKALAADSGTCAPHAKLAVLLQAQGRFDEAAASYQRALEFAPDDFQCLLNLGVCKIDQGQFVAGEALIRRAIAVNGEHARSWANLGVALAHQERHAEALEAFEHSDRLETKTGEDADNVVNFGLHLREAGRIDDALRLYERRLPSRPGPAGHNDYAFALLTAGRFAEGWHQYEFRWARPPLLDLRAGFNRPVWHGQDLRGKTIVLRAEQGFGDVIQFVRYAPLVKALGATVLLQVRTGLERLADGFSGIDRVLDRDQGLPNFDFYINLPSVPRVFGTDLASIPADVPYVSADVAAIERWQPELGGRNRLKVGIAWAGSPPICATPKRSIALAALAPVWGVAGVTFVSLQKGDAAAEADILLPEVDWVNVGQKLEDFSDTAAVISQLDLVISSIRRWRTWQERWASRCG